MNVHYLNLPAAQYVCRVLGFELEVIFFLREGSAQKPEYLIDNQCKKCPEMAKPKFRQGLSSVIN